MDDLLTGKIGAQSLTIYNAKNLEAKLGLPTSPFYTAEGSGQSGKYQLDFQKGTMTNKCDVSKKRSYVST